MWYVVESNKRMCELLKAQGNLDSSINIYRVQLSHTRIECVQYSFNDWVCINFVFGCAMRCISIICHHSDWSWNYIGYCIA